jgi:hypothetical protein
MMENTITPERPQYIVFFDHPEAPGKYSVRFFDGRRIAGDQRAAHEKLESVRLVIPMTHERAPFDQPAPIVEVWVLKEGARVTQAERYPRGWHPDRDY